MNEKMLKTIREFFKTQPIEKAWIFGSYARGEETPESDVDILVVFHEKEKISLLVYCGIKNSLEKLLNKEVDLVENGFLKPFAVESAERDKILIYEREN
ncbi:MAG: nucleotidyltransferase domain-containing protein [Bacteroidia bacterium]|nr:nucleotidyltransferase domain-containing protein [Bacteroidia bacterium]